VVATVMGYIPGKMVLYFLKIIEDITTPKRRQ
jgi:hypothetical protein